MFVYSPLSLFDSWKSILLGTTILAIVYGVWKVLYLFIIRPYLSPLRNLPGPKSSSILFGNFSEIFKAGPGELHAKWVDEYGITLSNRLMTYDSKALSYILNHSYDFQKPEEVRTNLAMLLGEGVLFAEGDSHKRQNPSFALSHIRNLTGIFHEKSQQLRDLLLVQAADKAYITDVLPWLGKATLDIIGLAGFDYEFNALNPDGKETELNSAFMTIFKQGTRITFLGILQSLIPLFRIIPTPRSRSIAKATKVMNRIGQSLVDNKRQAILATAAEKDGISGDAQIEKSSITTRDLLSRLMAANMATDLSENQRLSDAEVFGQIPTFLVAGNETTSTATVWCLYALSRNTAVQNKLREELLSVKTDTPSMEELNALPYLDSVIRETLRLYSPVSSTIRMATKDDIIPLGTPFTDKRGQLRHEILIKKGDIIFIPILPLNTYKGIWGEDAAEFRPERWQSLPAKASEIPGVASGMLTFIAGPRSCIGYRFAIVEFKCLVFSLIRALNFGVADPTHEIIKRSNIVTRPAIKSEADKGAQLPLRITPWRAA
ncbi:cytochrome P450 [Ramaria rubella]|nr:cytochrome P450 [Ramaria rubella]